MRNRDTSIPMRLELRISYVFLFDATETDLISLALDRHTTEVGPEFRVEWHIFFSLVPRIKEDLLVFITGRIDIDLAHQSVTMIVGRELCWSFRKGSKDAGSEWTNLARTFPEVCLGCFFYSIGIVAE